MSILNQINKESEFHIYQNKFFSFNFYQTGIGIEPIKVNNYVTLNNSAEALSLIIEVNTKNIIYPFNYNDLILKLYETNGIRNINMVLYQISGLGIPQVLPQSTLITAKFENTTNLFYREIPIGQYLIKSYHTYYFLLMISPEYVNIIDDVKLGVPPSVTKDPYLLFRYKTDSLLPQYTKYDFYQFSDNDINVNLFTGKIFIRKPLVSLPGKKGSINLSIIHNNFYDDYEYLNLTYKFYYSFANKWKYNYFQVLKKHRTADKYLYINDVGEQLYFSKVKDGYYINDNGKGLLLIKNANKYIIEDIHGNQLEFNSDGYLIYIRDNIESKVGTYTKGIKITYTNINDTYYLTSIKDSSNREVTFTYFNSYVNIKYKNNKTIRLNLYFFGVKSIVDEYENETKYTYNVNLSLNRFILAIINDVNSMSFLIENNIVKAMKYCVSNVLKSTKEYNYNFINNEYITSIIMYNKTKNDNNQIIRKYCFDVNGDYVRDYEEVTKNGEIYEFNEIKRSDFNINKDNEISVERQLKEFISDSDPIVFELDIDEDKKNYTREFSFKTKNKCKDYKLFYKFKIEKNYLLQVNDMDSKLNVTLTQNINSSSTQLETYIVQLNKVNGIFGLSDTNNKYIRDCGTYVEIGSYLNLNWNGYNNTTIKLTFNLNTEYIYMFSMEECNIFATQDSVPAMLLQNNIDGSIPVSNAYCYSIWGDDDIVRTNNIRKTELYLCSYPMGIKYCDDNNKYVYIYDIETSLNEMIINAINYVKRKNILWYNNFKNVVISDNLNLTTMSDCYLINDGTIGFSNFNLTFPQYKDEQLIGYYNYCVTYKSIQLEDESTKYIDYFNETYIGIRDDGRTPINIVSKDIYGRIIEEEYTDINYDNTTAGLTYDLETNFINSITKYIYDENNSNLLMKEIISQDIYYDDNNDENYLLTEYIYDETGNNVIQIKETRSSNNKSTTTITYDSENNISSVTSPTGTVNNYLYNDKNYLIEYNINNSSMKNTFTYNNDLLETYKYNDLKSGYKYVYDTDKRLMNISKINNTDTYNNLIESYEYVEVIPTNNLLGLTNGQTGLIITYANGEKFGYIYDKYNRLIIKKYYENELYNIQKEYIYGETECDIYSIYSNNDVNLITSCESLLRSEYDYITNEKIEYHYNDDKQLINIKKKTFDSSTYEETLIENNEIVYTNNIVTQTIINNFETNYLFGNGDTIWEEEKILSSDKKIYITNGNSSSGNIIYRKYGYSNNNQYFSKNNLFEYENGMLNSYTTPYKNYKYNLTYDLEGKITKVENSTINLNESEYTYDSYGQLTKEINRVFNKIYEYGYDNAGNVTFKKVKNMQGVLQEETYYRYEAPNYDALTSVTLNDGNELIVHYDSCMNINGIGYDGLEWEKGHQLSKYTKGTNEYNYYYNANGIRYKKALNKTNNEIIEYNLNGNTILSETRKKEVNGVYQVDCKLQYIYSGNELLGFIYEKDNTQTYYAYEKDALNNIISLVQINFDTKNYEVVAQYRYNAWGEHIVYDANGSINTSDTFIGNINPFRYKGYYYDVETNLFLVSSRYFSPELCRWISPDDVSYLDPSFVYGLNLYCYCFNNPIMYKDSSGNYPEPIGLFGDMISGFSESLGKVIWKHAGNYLKNPMTTKQAQKIIRKRGLNKSARALLRDYSDDALNSFKFGKRMDKLGSVLGKTLVVIDIGTTIYVNYKSGNDTWVSESAVDVGYTLIQTCIAEACTNFIPGVGWLVGIGINLLLDYIVEETGVIDDIKSFISQYDDEIREILFGRGILLGR